MTFDHHHKAVPPSPNRSVWLFVLAVIALQGILFGVRIYVDYARIVSHAKDDLHALLAEWRMDAGIELSVYLLFASLAILITKAILRNQIKLKQLENAAQTKVENETHLLEAVMDALPIGVAITDAKGGTLRSNAAFKKVWGGPLPETSSVADYDIYKAWWAETGVPVAPGEWASAIAVEKGKAVVGQVMRIQRFDNSVAFIINSASPVYDREGNMTGSAVAIQDITELKQTEEALRESEFFFKESQRAASIGSYKLDFMTGTWETSKILDIIFGIDPNYIRSVQGWLDIVHPDDREMMDHYLREEVIAKKSPFAKEYRIIRRNDGETRWVQGLGEIKSNPDGMLLSMMGTIQDITERKMAEMALQESRGDLDRAQEVGKLAAGVSMSAAMS